MKKTLLTAALLALTSMAQAQYTFDTALDAQNGECSTECTESTGYLYWKYTATEDMVIVATDMNNSYTVPDGYAYDSSTKLNHAYWSSGTEKAWNVSAGETLYLAMKAKLNKTVGFTFLASDWVPASATTADAPQTLQTGLTYYFGDCHTSGSQSAYASYTATENGTLDLALQMSCSSVTFNGTKITASSKHYTQEVEAGETISIVLTNSKPVVGSISFTAAGSTEEPEQGTLENPYELTVGANSVPAAAGKYYYTYTPTTTGYFDISSEETLENGYVKIYNLKSGISYNSPAATSSTGSYNVSAEVAYAATQPYYVEVTKNTATTAEQSFKFQMKDYEPGEKSTNPKVIEVPSENTLPRANCKFYYKVNVPAGTEMNLVVEATSTIESEKTTVYIYPEGSYYYTGKSGNGFVRYDVSSTADASYLIYWNATESSPVDFKVYYEDNAQGTSLDNPLTAVLGENTLVGTGTQYYKYTAASTGKLSITVQEGSTASFPLGTDVLYDGYYDAIVNGTTYSREVTEGSSYYIAIEKAVKDQTFLVEEGEFQQGDTQSDPIVVESDSYTVGATRQGNIWLSYTAPKAGTLTVKCDADYDAANEIDYGLTTDDSLYPLVSTTKVDGKTVYRYENSAAVAKDNVMLVHLKFANATKDCKVTFSMGTTGVGESWETAYELKYDTPLNVGTPTAKTPVWVKLATDGTDIQIVSSDQASGSWYAGDEAAEADKATSSFTFANTSAYDDGSIKGYLNTWTESPAGNYYMKLTNSWDYDITLTLLSAEYTGISAISAESPASTVVYSLKGQKLATTTTGLKPGIYLVHANGTTRKVVVK